MKPADLRNATWREVLTHFNDDLRRVHDAWHAFGPGTTREVAAASGISLLTFRPRTTDLFQLGCVRLSGSVGTEGIYEFVPLASAALAWDRGERPDVKPGRERRERRKIERLLRHLPDSEQLALAASILARRGRHRPRPATAAQPELALA